MLKRTCLRTPTRLSFAVSSLMAHGLALGCGGEDPPGSASTSATSTSTGGATTTGGGGGDVGGGSGSGGGDAGGGGGGPVPTDCNVTKCYYVLEGSGAEGTDWSNALPSLPAELERGATYFVGDGTYGAYTFDDDDSDGQVITIKRPTASDHGTEKGWTAAHADGEALFTGEDSAWTFLAGHYVVDGKTGTKKAGYGFRLTVTQAFRSAVIRIGDEYHPTIRDITLAHLDASAPGQALDETVTCDNNDNDDPNCPINDIINASGLVDSTISDNYLHGSTWHANIWSADWSNVVIQNNYFHNSNRKEGIAVWGSSGVVVRNNTWENTAGTGIIAFADAKDWVIHGNVFFTTNPTYTTSDCAICVVSGHGYVTDDIRIYSNTFVNLESATSIHFDVGRGNEVYNNVFYGPNGMSLGSTAMSHDYNWCFDTTDSGQCSSVADEPNGAVGTGDLFVDATSGDFRLKNATPAGLPLDPPYDIDPLGEVRGADGVWDRGAYEFHD